MEAIILAGGFGTRLRPLTYTRAKPLLPILNRPMISYFIDMLPQEVEKVILAVNYKKDMIEQYFKSNDCGRTVIVNDEPEPLGTGGAVKYAEKHITDTFFVLNSDTLCSLRLDEMLRFHTKNNATTTISLWPVENVSEFGVVDIKDNNKIVDFVEKPPAEEAPSDLINAGAYILEPEILDYIETKKLVSMEQEIFPQIIRDTNQFYGFEFSGYWFDVGRIESYFEVHNFLLKHYNKDNAVGLNTIQQGTLTNSVLGNNSTIGHNSQLDSSIIFDETHIGENVTLEKSIIAEHCEISDNVTLKNTVIGGNETIKTGTKLTNTAVWTQPIPKGYPKKQIGNVINK